MNNNILIAELKETSEDNNYIFKDVDIDIVVGEQEVYIPQGFGGNKLEIGRKYLLADIDGIYRVIGLYQANTIFEELKIATNGSVINMGEQKTVLSWGDSGIRVEISDAGINLIANPNTVMVNGFAVALIGATSTPAAVGSPVVIQTNPPAPIIPPEPEEEESF